MKQTGLCYNVVSNNYSKSKVLLKWSYLFKNKKKKRKEGKIIVIFS